jgi:hypothetical protein
MNIQIVHDEVKKVNFDDVMTGQVFLTKCGDRVEKWLRITGCEDYNDEVLFNAVNLETGEVEDFRISDIVIIPKDMEFVINY